MDPITLLRTALGALWMNKLRTSLTLLGIVIGVAAVISLMGVGRGAQKAITDNITALGTNLIYVRPESGRDVIRIPVDPGSGGGGRVAMGASSQQQQGPNDSSQPLTVEDAYALLDPVYAPSVEAVAPEIRTGGRFVFGRDNMYASIIGTTPDYLSVRNAEMEHGTFITGPHVEARSRVMVLGSRVAEQLFGQRDPTGQTVRVNGQPYVVLGVMASQGGNAGQSFDNQAVVPVTTAHFRLNGQEGTQNGGTPVQNINVEAVDESAVNDAMEEIESILRLRHRITGENDFTLTSQQQTIEALQDTTNTFVLFLAAIAGISLVVGGIGIMNIMLVSVTERTREIGIRKALGAKKRDVLFQFSLEAVLLSVAGGALGVAIGYALARGATALGALGGFGPGGEDSGIQAVFTPDIALLALGVSAGIGLFFGIYPAVRAARLQPVEALRYQ